MLATQKTQNGDGNVCGNINALRNNEHIDTHLQSQLTIHKYT